MSVGAFSWVLIDIVGTHCVGATIPRQVGLGWKQASKECSFIVSASVAAFSFLFVSLSTLTSTDDEL